MSFLQLTSLPNVVDFSIMVVICILMCIFFAFHCRRKVVLIGYFILFLGYIVASFFAFTNTATILAIVLLIFSFTFIFVNISEFRSIMGNTVKRKKDTKVEVAQGPKKEELYRMIDEAVHILSKTKTGAILTFEKSTSLQDILRNGTLIHAPVCVELLTTIFYPGTRLHDGAVVIRGNIIVAASVYYTPTTRALTGKYGSRHRAAFGISEITDAVTVVVSEETGRVSIACLGKLESVSLDAFLEEFSEYMARE